MKMKIHPVLLVWELRTGAQAAIYVGIADTSWRTCSMAVCPRPEARRNAVEWCNRPARTASKLPDIFLCSYLRCHRCLTCAGLFEYIWSCPLKDKWGCSAPEGPHSSATCNPPPALSLRLQDWGLQPSTALGPRFLLLLLIRMQTPSTLGFLRLLMQTTRLLCPGISQARIPWGAIPSPGHAHLQNKPRFCTAVYSTAGSLNVPFCVLIKIETQAEAIKI